jgi:hypothetical protein
MVPQMQGKDFPTLPLMWILLALGASVLIMFAWGTRMFQRRVVT